jgi:hypothetical protein
MTSWRRRSATTSRVRPKQGAPPFRLVAVPPYGHVRVSLYPRRISLMVTCAAAACTCACSCVCVSGRAGCSTLSARHCPSVSMCLCARESVSAPYLSHGDVCSSSVHVRVLMRLCVRLKLFSIILRISALSFPPRRTLPPSLKRHQTHPQISGGDHRCARCTPARTTPTVPR